MDPSKNPNDPNRSKSPSGQQDTSGATPSRKVSVTGLSSLPSVEEFDAFLDQDVFSLADSERFTMSLVHGQDELPESKTRFDERDYQSHRRESFPHPHQPLKPMRSLRKKSSASKDHHHHHHAPSDSKAEPMAIPVTTNAPSTGPNEEFAKRLEKLPGSSPPVNLTNPLAGAFDIPADDDLDNNSILNVIVSSLPPTSSAFSPRAHSSSFPTYDDLMEHYGKKVQFEVGGSPIHSVGLGNEDETNVEKKKHKSHRSQKYEDPQWRLRLGSEIKEDADTPLLFRDVDVADMADLDKDDLTSHRFGDAKGFRRHKFYLREPEAVVTSPGVRSVNKYDHSPHEIFVELDMLTGLGEEREWKETARWIKYEEDLEEGADRWGRPHVASLSFHSLLNLRRLIEAGVVLLDLEERDLPGVAYRVVDQMVINELVDPDCKGYVMRSLLLKHKHVNDGDRNWKFNLRRNAGSVTSLQNSGDDKMKPRPSLGNMEAGVLSRRNSATVTTGSRGLYDMAMNGRRNGSHSGPFLLPENHMQQLQHTAIDFSKISLSHLSEEDLRWMTNKESILRRIPTGAEATVVLVGRDDHLSGPALAFVRLAESVYMPNITEVPIPVRFIFILLGPSSFDLDYKEIGRSVATLMSNREFHDIAYKADDRKDLLKGIHEYLDESIVLPPGEYEKELFPFEELKEKHQALKLRKQRMSVAAGMAGAGGAGEGGDNFDGLKLLQERKSSAAESLTRTRRCFGGLIRDIKRRYPLYLSDFKDGLSVQCIAAIIFIAFAQICGSIAFGGLIETKTKSILGITETLFTSAIGGMMFSLFSCQPLLIVGTSGPLVLFDESLFQFCESNGIDFLAMRIWIGFWLGVIGVVFVAFEASVFVRFFTRFTQEIFSSLVSLLFIMESLQNLLGIYESHPLVSTYGNCTMQDGEAVLEPGTKDRNQPNTALLCTILMFGTFYVAWILRSFRGSNFLTKCIRDTLGNFAVPIAIGSMVLADFLIKETVTQKLKSPKGFSPTMPRSWLVDPGLVKSWIPAVGLLPALLLFILVFMETSIAELIVSKKDNKLKKGTGFHMDVLLICCTNTVLCIFGLPWASVALVRAVAHMSALTVWSTNNPPGEKPKIVGIREQRLTNCIVSILTGASIAMASVLSIVPLAVLFGVFLFMGVSSMSGIEFFQRVALFFKQVENHPQKPFVRRVKTWKMHLFTGIQIFWLGVLWGVKYTVVALSFPFILLILVPFRFFVLKLIFSPEELSALDSGGEDKKEPKIIVEAPVSEKHEVNGNKVSHLTRLLDDKVTVDPSSKVELKVTPPPPNDRL